MNKLFQSKPAAKGKQISVWLTLGAFVFGAIVVISPHLASAETPASSSMLKQMMGKTRPATFAEGALDTPFFDATEAPHTLAQKKGRGLVVNFWATWCAPCIREMPSLDRLAKALEGSGVDVIAISEDRKALKKVPIFYTKRNIQNLPLFYDVKSTLSRKIGAVGLPTTILINAKGEAIGRIMGTLEWDDKGVKDYLVKTLAAQTP